jgi:hypothetical protein
MKFINTLIGILFLGSSCFAQIQVNGKVFNESGGIIYGASIQEKGTTNLVTSDFMGDFSIKCISKNPILVFNYIVTATQEIPVKSDTTFNVVLVQIVQSLSYYSRVAYIGLNSGLNHNRLGIETRDFIPRLLHLFPSVIFENNQFTNIKWRFFSENTYLKLEAGQYSVVKLSHKSSLGLKVNYQHVALANSDFLAKQVSLSTIYRSKGLTTWFGYARRELKGYQDVNYSKGGINVGIRKVLFKRLHFDFNTTYWLEDWQYSFHLDTRIPKTRINLGLDWEKINDWEEFGISVLYSFYYH